ncbi:putative trp protein for ciliary function [Blattamonas nauphoetae]|uniref:Trp protein for ciliary function n=1 Tax=Blattamonas nauphoetae TaxID=2049346 RepID=A0ABQ9YMZ4_9EUKA|nr:putative trp protein for ciliary function [Blattamonas nauphoetae]
MERPELEDSAQYLDSTATLSDQATGLSTFVHLSDLHMGNNKLTSKQFESFVSEILEYLIKPSTVLVTGDLVDGMDGIRTLIDTPAWNDYFEPIRIRGWNDCKQWLDLRGNHDSSGLINHFDNQDLFVNYSSCGSLKKTVYSHVLQIPTDELFLDQVNAPSISFILLDSIPSMSLVQPFNFFASLSGQRSENGSSINSTSLFLDELDAIPENSLGTFISMHSPLLSTNTKTRTLLKQCLSGTVKNRSDTLSLLDGHFHMANMDLHFFGKKNGGSGKRTRLSTEATISSFSNQRSFRLYTIDHGLIATQEFYYGTDQTFAHLQGVKTGLFEAEQPSFFSSVAQTVRNVGAKVRGIQAPGREVLMESGAALLASPLVYVQVTNPLSAELTTARMPWTVVQNSTHIRSIIHSQRVVVRAWVDIFEGDKAKTDKFVQAKSTPPYSFNLTLTTKPNPNNIPLFVAEWNASDFLAKPFYTLYTHVVVDNSQPINMDPALSSLLTQTVNGEESEIELVFAGHTFSVSGYTIVPPVSVPRVIMSWPVEEITIVIIAGLTLIPLIVLVFAQLVSVFASVLRKVDSSLEGEEKQSAILMTCSLRMNGPNSNKITIAAQRVVSGRVVCIAFLSGEVETPKTKPSTETEEMVSVSQVLVVTPGPEVQEVKSDVGHESSYSSSIDHNDHTPNQSQHTPQPTEKPADTIDPNPTDLPKPEEPSDSQKEARAQPRFAVRLLSFLIINLYPYYHMPLFFSLICVLFIISLHLAPHVSGYPDSPILPVHIGLWTGWQGGEQITRVDSQAVIGGLLMMAYVYLNMLIISQFCVFFFGNPQLPPPLMTRSSLSPYVLVAAILALSYFNRRKYDECIALCVDLLTKNPLDQSAWFLKVRAMTAKSYIDDTEMEDEAIGDLLMDSNATADQPRPGTSLNKPKTARPTSSSFSTNRPVSSTGRPITGFARPGTSTIRPQTGATSTAGLQRLLTASRGSTSRPTTASGRLVRLGTASLSSMPPGANIEVSKLDLQKYSTRPALAKALCDYLLYVEHNPRMALQLTSFVLERDETKNDWWWNERMGKIYYQLGLLRDSETSMKKSLMSQEMLLTYLELGKIYLRLDDPRAALDAYSGGTEVCRGNVHLLCAMARVHDMMDETKEAERLYREVLRLDASNVEALACLGTYYFYAGQCELALRFFKRLISLSTSSTSVVEGAGYTVDQKKGAVMGSGNWHVPSPTLTLATSAEVWNNIALCCMEAGQTYAAITYFMQALQYANDEEQTSDIWYNIGNYYIQTGDLTLAYQAFRVSNASNGNNAEALNALGVLDMRRGNLDSSRVFLSAARDKSPFLSEAYFNGALLARRLGDTEEAAKLMKQAEQLMGETPEVVELKRAIEKDLMGI